jgi:hypothetical protein
MAINFIRLVEINYINMLNPKLNHLWIYFQYDLIFVNFFNPIIEYYLLISLSSLKYHHLYLKFYHYH